MKTNSILGLAVLVVTFGLSGCGGSGGATSISNLGQLPSTSQLISTSDVSSGYTRAAVSGTPPLLKDIDEDAAEEIFFGDVLSTIIGAEPESCSLNSRFFGGVANDVGGEGACRMAQSVGYSFEPILQSGTSLCYMKGIPTASSGVAITPTLSNPETIFNQQSDDRVVRVNILNDPFNNEENSSSEGMTVFIKVHGSSSVGSSVYKATLWFCNGSEVTGSESVEVNKSTGRFSATSIHTDGGESAASITAFVKDEGSDVVFDTTKERHASVSHKFTGGGNNGRFKSDITITSDNLIKVKTYNQFSYTYMSQNYTNTDKNYSVAEFSGGNVRELRFLQAAFKGYFEQGANNHSYSGATEWSDTFYKALSSSPLDSDRDSVSFSSDSFFSAISDPEVDLSDFSCDQSVSYTVTMDFDDDAVAAIGDECEADRLNDMNFCDSSTIRQARDDLFSGVCI